MEGVMSHLPHLTTGYLNFPKRGSVWFKPEHHAPASNSLVQAVIGTALDFVIIERSRQRVRLAVFTTSW